MFKASGEFPAGHFQEGTGDVCSRWYLCTGPSGQLSTCERHNNNSNTTTATNNNSTFYTNTRTTITNTNTNTNTDTNANSNTNTPHTDIDTNTTTSKNNNSLRWSLFFETAIFLGLGEPVASANLEATVSVLPVCVA